MKKLFVLTLIMLALFTTTVAATEVNDSTKIPEMNMEELIQTMQARQAKVDIIKKNNLKIEISKDNVVISDEAIEELKELLTFLQESKKTLEEDVEKISKEIEGILDLISTKSMQQLDQYDLIIEKQNEVIVRMKAIMETVSKI